jgi:hypothetical protein
MNLDIAKKIITWILSSYDEFDQMNLIFELKEDQETRLGFNEVARLIDNDKFKEAKALIETLREKINHPELSYYSSYIAMTE